MAVRISFGVVFLLANGRKNYETTVANLQHGLGQLTILVSDLYAVQTLNAHLLHLLADRAGTVSGEAVDAGAHQKDGCRPSAGRCRTVREMFALAIADVDTAFGIIQEGGGLPQVFQPADALLLFYGYSGSG